MFIIIFLAYNCFIFVSIIDNTSLRRFGAFFAQSVFCLNYFFYTDSKYQISSNTYSFCVIV